MLFGLFPTLLGGKTEISMLGFMCFCLNSESWWPPFVGGPRPRPTRPRPKEGPELDLNRAENLVVCRDYWMSRSTDESFKFCHVCTQHPSAAACYKISCAEHQISQELGVKLKHFC